jgi:hypothetical protein
MGIYTSTQNKSTKKHTSSRKSITMFTIIILMIFYNKYRRGISTLITGTTSHTNCHLGTRFGSISKRKSFKNLHCKLRKLRYNSYTITKKCSNKFLSSLLATRPWDTSNIQCLVVTSLQTFNYKVKHYVS